MTASAIDNAVDAVAEFFRDRESRCGVLARRILGLRRPADDDLRDHLVRERRRRTRMDGSVGGSLVDTAWLAWELLELGCPSDHAAVLRTLGFVASRQDAPGHFAEGCTERAHEARLCRHYLGGFFSPGSRDVAVAPLSFPSGLVVAGEARARFAASCFALRSALRGGEERRTTVVRHVDALLTLDALWEARTEEWPLDLALFGLGALAFAPLGTRSSVAPLIARVLDRQAADGSWPGTDPWHALDMLVAMPVERVRLGVQRAVGPILAAQDASGAFGGDHEERTFIALRALLLARA
jgi:hypothetical protein